VPFAHPNIIRVPTRYSTIQEAINHAYYGDIVFVSSGTYYENVVVNKTLNLIGEDPETTVIDGGGVGDVVNVTADNATVMGFKMRNGACGIMLHRAQNCNVTGNNIADNRDYGASLQCYSLIPWEDYRPCFNDMIVGNNITNSSQAIFAYAYTHWGRGPYSSFNNTIAENNITSCPNGISLEFSDCNIITGNSVVGGIGLLGICRWNVISENNVEGGINLGAVDWFMSYYFGGYDNTISRNNVTGGSCGISVTLASNIRIVENNVTSNLDGVWLSGSYGNYIIGNSIVANDGFGVALDWTWYCQPRNISWASDENTISDNNIAGNGVGVWLNFSSSNRVFHNNFVQNSLQTQLDSSSLNNTWDDGYPSGGNYWSDYTDVDLCSGPNQDQPGSDAIWDHPYTIDANNTDNYPLSGPYSPPRALTVESVVVVNQGCTVYADDRDSGGVNPYNVQVQVTVKNVGTIDMGAFNVSLTSCWQDGSLNESVAEQRVSSLTAGQNVTLTYSWHPMRTGNYSLTAFADCHSEVAEGNETDNMLLVQDYPVALMGDVNGDHINNILDIIQVGLAWHSYPGEPTWKLQADLNHDGTIDILDIIRITLQWHQTW
jgi:parallel beta-helix repeat protein